MQEVSPTFSKKRLINTYIDIIYLLVIGKKILSPISKSLGRSLTAIRRWNIYFGFIGKLKILYHFKIKRKLYKIGSVIYL